MALRTFSNMLTLTVTDISLYERANKSQIPKFELSYFSSNFNAVSFKMIIFYGVIDGLQKTFARRSLKGPKFPNYAYVEGMQNFYFSSNFDTVNFFELIGFFFEMHYNDQISSILDITASMV